MQAAWYERRGAARDVLHVSEMPDLSAGPGEVRIRMEASAVNPTDTKSRAGVRATGPLPYPRVIPHQDGAGIIDQVGEAVDRSRVGERVWIYEAQWQRPFGTAAQFCAVPADHAVRLPANTSIPEGACLGIPAMTAHRCLFQDGPIEGKTIVVTGGAGGVGYYAVQLAKWGNARVIATVGSPEQAEMVRSAGADHVINRKSEDVAARVLEITGNAKGGVDRVVEVAFGPNLPTNVRILKPNGVIATYASDEELEPKVYIPALMAKALTIRVVLVYLMDQEAHHQAARDISSCLEAGALRHSIARRFPLNAIIDAHEAMEAGHLNGKAIVEIP